jgi:beta-mannanase
MNDPYRYPWGPQYNKPEDYIAAWRHVVDRFRKIGADNNAIWIWSPHPAYTSYAQYYPGKDYVDWIGVGALNYGIVAPWSKWWSFHDIFNNFYSKVSLYDKPMMISEFGSLEVGGDRVVWLKQALDSLPYKFPKVKSIVFYNNSNDNTTTYKVLDWSITKDESALKAVRGSFNNWKKLSKVHGQ